MINTNPTSTNTIDTYYPRNHESAAVTFSPHTNLVAINKKNPTVLQKITQQVAAHQTSTPIKDYLPWTEEIKNALQTVLPQWIASNKMSYRAVIDNVAYTVTLTSLSEVISEESGCECECKQKEADTDSSKAKEYPSWEEEIINTLEKQVLPKVIQGELPMEYYISSPTNNGSTYSVTIKKEPIAPPQQPATEPVQDMSTTETAEIATNWFTKWFKETKESPKEWFGRLCHNIKVHFKSFEIMMKGLFVPGITSDCKTLNPKK